MKLLTLCVCVRVCSVDRRQSFTTRVFSQPPSPLPSDELLTVPAHNSRRWSSARTSTDSPQHNHHGRPLRVAARLPRAVSSPSVNSSRHHSAGPRIDSPGTPSSSSSAYQRRRRRRANQALFSGSSRDSPTAVSSSEESVGTSSGSARRRARRAQQQQQQQQHQHQLLLQQKLQQQQQQQQQQQYARTLRSSNPNQSESPSASPADTTLLKSLSSSAPSLSVFRSSSLNAAAQPQYRRRRSARPAAAAAAAAASSSSSSSATSSHRPVWPGSTSSTSIVRRFSDDVHSLFFFSLSFATNENFYLYLFIHSMLLLMSLMCRKCCSYVFIVHSVCNVLLVCFAGCAAPPIQSPSIDAKAWQR